MAKIGIIGSQGRMGQALAAAFVAAGDVIAGGIDQGGDPFPHWRAGQPGRWSISPAAQALEANLDAAIASGTSRS